MVIISFHRSDTSYVTGFDEWNEEVIVDMDGREVRYLYSDTDQISLAYATTVHKAQGSEFPVVLLILVGHHASMLERNLVYTANTRAKQLAIWIAEKWTISKAVENNNVKKRNSLLHFRIRGAVPKDLIPELMVKLAAQQPVAASA